jgi:hypothetical protein
MTKKPNSKGTPELLMKVAPIALLLLFGNQLLAQTSSPQPAAEAGGVTVLEILGYVGMIVAVILLAWIIGSAQSKDKPNAEAGPRPHHHRHFDHPNDPHFRKLKKKTS